MFVLMLVWACQLRGGCRSRSFVWMRGVMVATIATAMMMRVVVRRVEGIVRVAKTVKLLLILLIAVQCALQLQLAPRSLTTP